MTGPRITPIENDPRRGCSVAHRRWTDDEVADLLRWRRDGTHVAVIAQRLARTVSQVEGKIAALRTRRMGDDGVTAAVPTTRELAQAGIPPKLLLERERRDEARAAQDLTAAFFGDPPKGFSALDRKQRRGA